MRNTHIASSSKCRPVSSSSMASSIGEAPVPPVLGGQVESEPAVLRQRFVGFPRRLRLVVAALGVFRGAGFAEQRLEMAAQRFLVGSKREIQACRSSEIKRRRALNAYLIGYGADRLIEEQFESERTIPESDISPPRTEDAFMIAVCRGPPKPIVTVQLARCCSGLGHRHTARRRAWPAPARASRADTSRSPRVCRPP